MKDTLEDVNLNLNINFNINVHKKKFVYNTVVHGNPSNFGSPTSPAAQPRVPPSDL